MYAFYVLLACNLGVFAYALYVRAHVKATNKALAELDWETLVTLTGDMATVKKSVQKLSNRINGMNNIDPQQILAELPQLQSVTQSNGRTGG
jgi:paraquat-inducible protein B